MQANGYAPVPCMGKRPAIAGWQHKTNASVDEMRMWSGANTGILCANTPAIDIDITDPEAAAVAEEVAKELFGDRGTVPVRFGRLPKRTLPFRTTAPFPKMSASFEAPNSTTHKIEVLADGQQFIAFGIQPDTKYPYTWHGRTPLDTPHEELPEITEEDMQAYLELVSERLEAECGFKRVFTNGRGAEHEAGPVDADKRLRSMRFGGAGDNAIHPTQLHVTASLLRNGLSFDETVRTVLEATKKAVAGDHRAKVWDWDEEQLGLERMCASFISKNPELAPCLPGQLREPFERKLAEGREPYLIYRKDRGWHVAAMRGMGDRRFNQAARAATGEQEARDAVQRPNGPRFRLVPFADLKPGPEPLYLVDELVPIAGLVDVWGKAKCFKSFWTLDLMLHV